MDHEISEQNVLPEQMFCSPFPSQNLTLNSAKISLENVTPVSRLCVALDGASIRTSVESPQQTLEIVDTPQKSFLQRRSAHLDTPSVTCLNSNMQTSVETPICTPIQNITKNPLSLSLGEKFGTSVKLTPRRSRRSCLNKSQIVEQEQKVSMSSVLKRNSLRNPCVSQSICVNSKSDKSVSPESDTVLLDILHETIVNHKGETSNVRKSLFLGTESNPYQSPVGSVQHNPLDWLPATFEGRGVTTEPRERRKTDIEGYSSRRLSFSSKKSSNKQKYVEPEYDPDNDIFAQGLMPNQFNVDVNLLKNEIGKCLLNAVEPPSRLTKSSSCSALSDVKEISQTPYGTSVSSTRKPQKDSPSSAPKAWLKRTASAPDILSNVGFGSTSTPGSVPTKLSAAASDVKVTSEGKIKAYLRARDIIKNIRKRAQNVPNKPTVPVDPSIHECVEDDNDEIIQKSFNLQVNLQAQTNECRRENKLLLNAAVNELDDADLPPTQPFESLILGDVTAYVEVISNNEDLSVGVGTELTKLGATVVKSFNKNVPVTHVVFNNGRLSTYKKAKKRNVPLVSVLWIEECRRAGVKVHESLFPPYQIERYESPNIVKELRRRRIIHFYPYEKPRSSPRRKKDDPRDKVIEAVEETTSSNCTVRKSAPVPKWVDEVAGDNGMVRILVKMTGIGKKEFKDLVERPPTPDSDVDCEENSPLPVRLLRKLAKNLPVKNLISDNTFENDEQIDKEVHLNVDPSFENSFVKKLNEISQKEGNEALEEENTKRNELSQPENTDGSLADNSVSQNSKLKKKSSKRKLLSPVAESLSISQNADEIGCTDIENPHSNASKQLSCDHSDKKMKLDISRKEPSKESANTESQENEVLTSETCVQNTVDPIRRSRRSSAYFIKNKKCSPSPVPQKPAIVCSLLRTTDVDVIASIVEKLGIYVIEKRVTNRSTHIVMGASKRTMKVLKGMARGCWIVSQEWVLKSLEANRWLDEEEFELTAFSPAVQKYRLEKLSFGGVFQADIFHSCGPIFVSSRATAPRGDLVELILLCGGRITSRITKAQVAIGRKHSGVVCVTALWVLDSVQFYCCKPFESYLLS